VENLQHETRNPRRKRKKRRWRRRTGQETTKTRLKRRERTNDEGNLTAEPDCTSGLVCSLLKLNPMHFFPELFPSGYRFLLRGGTLSRTRTKSYCQGALPPTRYERSWFLFAKGWKLLVAKMDSQEIVLAKITATKRRIEIELPELVVPTLLESNFAGTRKENARPLQELLNRRTMCSLQ